MEAKEKVIEILNEYGISHNITNCGGCDRICISFSEDKEKTCDCAITVRTCNKEVIYRVHPRDILYVAIENRKSVLYLKDRKIETHYHIEYWKSILKEKCFAQPHYSYIVNLNYVGEVTKDSVKIKYKDKEYSVYTSSRKIGAFKKALLEFNC